jgi:hypothetical protein
VARAGYQFSAAVDIPLTRSAMEANPINAVDGQIELSATVDTTGAA